MPRLIKGRTYRQGNTSRLYVTYLGQVTDSEGVLHAIYETIKSPNGFSFGGVLLITNMKHAKLWKEVEKRRP